MFGDEETSSKMTKNYHREYQMEKIKRANAEMIAKNAYENAKKEAKIQIDLHKKKIENLEDELKRKKTEIKEKD